MNTTKTFLLLAALTALFGVVGYLLGGQVGLIVSLIIAAGLNVFSYWNSDKLVLRMYGAQALDEGHWVTAITYDLAEKAGLPPPRVYMINSTQPNAFATGRNPQHAAVAVTRGIVDALDRRELSGVIAHELAHIQNRDTLTMTITATIAGALSVLANMGRFIGGGRRRGGQGGVHGAALLFTIILAPLAASIVQMAISRTREFSADFRGAEICGDPLALASALDKIQKAATVVPNRTAQNNPATAHLFIIPPLGKIAAMETLFSTHPKTELRIAKLRAQAMNMKQKDFTPNNPWD